MSSCIVIASYKSLHPVNSDHLPPSPEPQHQTLPAPPILAMRPSPKLIPRHIPPHKLFNLAITHPLPTSLDQLMFLLHPPLIDVRIRFGADLDEEGKRGVEYGAGVFEVVVYLKEMFQGVREERGGP